MSTPHDLHARPREGTPPEMDQETPGRVAPASADFESFPLTRPEYISAMVHFYRGEMHRSQVWRTRLDTTTNWAVVTTGGMISFAFSSPNYSAVTLLIAAVLITNFLLIEARRYRYFSVFRARVRMIEENFYLPLIRRSLVSPKMDWRDLIATDLDQPTFKTTFLEAVLFRLSRNYLWLYAVILMTWIVKLEMHPAPAQGLGEFYARMAVGPFPAWLVLIAIVGACGGLTLLLFSPLGRRGATDEIRGLERELSHWKL